MSHHRSTSLLTLESPIEKLYANESDEENRRLRNWYSMHTVESVRSLVGDHFSFSPFAVHPNHSEPPVLPTCRETLSQSN